MASCPIREEALFQVCRGSRLTRGGLKVIAAFPLAAVSQNGKRDSICPLAPFIWLLVAIDLSRNLPEVSWAFGLCLFTNKLLHGPSLSCKGGCTKHFHDFQVGTFIPFVGNSLLLSLNTLTVE